MKEYRTYSENLKGRDNLADPGGYRRTVLKGVLK
jgi:hypothetical protein